MTRWGAGRSAVPAARVGPAARVDEARPVVAATPVDAVSATLVGQAAPLTSPPWLLPLPVVRDECDLRGVGARE